jgi:hypothetical protein
VISAGAGADVFTFASGQAGGRVEIDGFRLGADHISLQGYAPGAADAALRSAQTASGSTTLVLPDRTAIVLPGVSSPSALLFA